MTLSLSQSFHYLLSIRRADCNDLIFIKIDLFRAERVADRRVAGWIDPYNLQIRVFTPQKQPFSAQFRTTFHFFTPFDLSDGILVRLSIYSNSTNQVEDIIYNY
jgi:hypothetical protein